MKKLLFIFVLLISFSVNAAGVFVPPEGEPTSVRGQDACQFAVDVQAAPGFYQNSILEGALVARVQTPSKSGGTSGGERELKIKDFRISIVPRGVERPDIKIDGSVLDPTTNNFWTQNNIGEWQRFQKADFIITDQSGKQGYLAFNVLIQRDGSSKGQLFSTQNHSNKLKLEVAFIIDLFGERRVVSYMKYKEPNFYDTNYALCLQRLKNITVEDLKNFKKPPDSAPSTGGAAK